MTCGDKHICQNCGIGYMPTYKKSQQKFCSSFCRTWWYAFLKGSRPDYNELRRHALSGRKDEFMKEFKEKRKSELKKSE